MCFHHLHPSYHRLLGCPTLPSWTNQDLATYGLPAQSNKIQIDKKNTQANWFFPHPLSCYQQLKECLISLIRCDIQHIKSSLLVRHTCSSVNQYPWFIISIGIYISIPIDTSSTLHRQSTNFCWCAIECWSLHISWSTLCEISTNSQSRVDRVSIDMSIKSQCIVDQVSSKMLTEMPIEC